MIEAGKHVHILPGIGPEVATGRYQPRNRVEGFQNSMSDSTSDDEPTIEVPARTAAAVLHILGLQQWLCPNHPAEYAKEGLARADGVVRFHEAYLEAVDIPGGTVPRETAAKVAVERHLDHVNAAFAADIAVETDLEYHGRLEATIQTRAEEESTDH